MARARIRPAIRDPGKVALPGTYVRTLRRSPIALARMEADATSTQTAVIKEGLRMFPSAIAHPRVVPPEGAVISGSFIPGGVGRNGFSFHAAVTWQPLVPFFWLSL